MHKLTINDTTVWCYSLTHGLIDLASSLVVYNAAIVHGLPPEKAVSYTLAYSLIAFALQPVAGFIIDIAKRARSATLFGIVVTLAGVVLMHVDALSSIVVVGMGNALFHVGAGGQILSRYRDQATSVGIFVGPGAIGLSIGIWFGNRGLFPLWPLVIGLMGACLALAVLPGLKAIPLATQNAAPKRLTIRLFAVLLLFAAILIRGFVGRTGFSGLPSEALITIGLGVSACVGKMAGGAIADRFGWGRTAIVALLFASIGLIFVHDNICLAFATMMLFQMTMPITLAATSAALPGKPAFAFGLASLALVTGTLPAFFAPREFIQTPSNLAMICISGACIIVALWKSGYLTGRNPGTNSAAQY